MTNRISFASGRQLAAARVFAGLKQTETRGDCKALPSRTLEPVLSLRLGSGEPYRPIACSEYRAHNLCFRV
jgi:hypothetical protein